MPRLPNSGDLDNSHESSSSLDDSCSIKRINEYYFGETIGLGAYGKVKESVDTKSKRRVAIKIINIKKLKRKMGGKTG